MGGEGKKKGRREQCYGKGIEEGKCKAGIRKKRIERENRAICNKHGVKSYNYQRVEEG